LIYQTKPKAMNLQITFKQNLQLIEGLNGRIQEVEKLIATFNSMTLVAEYVKERNELIELKEKLLSII
jgi:hypothetical protein